jgi:hypothetical protein
MNRIVQRNGAAPPWVEVQGGQSTVCQSIALFLMLIINSELESALTSFREILRQSWIRRALRILIISRPPALLQELALADVTALRDPEWEARERSYHDKAVEEINSLVRKYNGLAPYAVRRVYYARDLELKKAFEDAGLEILQGIKERTSKHWHGTEIKGTVEDSEKSGVSVDAGLLWRIRDVIREWLFKLTGR